MEFDGVNKDELQPIYDVTHVSSLGSVYAYERHAEALGYKAFSFESRAANVNTHYEVRIKTIYMSFHLKGQSSS